MSNKVLNLHQVRYLLVHKPLSIVKLEHSTRNKELIVTALKSLRRHPQSEEMLKVLRQFLEDVAPRYNLTPNQDGARKFLLRELDKMPEQPQGLVSSLMAMFGRTPTQAAG